MSSWNQNKTDSKCKYITKELNQNLQPKVHGSLWSTVLAIILLSICPPFSILLVYAHTHLDSSILGLWDVIKANGINVFREITPPLFEPVVLIILIVFACIQAFLQVALPGKEFRAPISPAGNIPIYKDNGFLSYFVVNFLFWSSYLLGLWNPAIVFDNLVGIIHFLCVFTLFFCTLLYFKGIFYPSSTDSGITGNVIFDYFWGTELHPRLFSGKLDVKQFTNCRFGMMAWTLLPYVYAIKQYQTFGFVADSMIVSVAIQQIYCAKFFYWETGYFASLDIMHDRAGFMICWGCLVWVPSVYTSHTMFLTLHPIHLGIPLACAIFVFGILGVILNYDADRQRYEFRQNGEKIKVWGTTPQFIVARYTTERGEEKQNKLLTSGYWGIARHVQYNFELMAAFSWCVPALFDYVLPYFYFVFLFFLLVDRAMRDHHRCSLKYKEDWQKYCETVPYNMIPYVW